MSWVNIVNKNIDQKIVKSKNNNNNKNTIIIKKDTNEISNEEYFDIVYGNELLNDIINIKRDIVHYTPWLFQNANNIDIYNFIYQYVDIDLYTYINDMEPDNKDIEEYDEYN